MQWGGHQVPEAKPRFIVEVDAIVALTDRGG
jgi:hypothetical protein